MFGTVALMLAAPVGEAALEFSSLEISACSAWHDVRGLHLTGRPPRVSSR